ncbi:MAG: hypothetical protein WC055_17075 [Melioribacteraceae bacterium]
MTFDSKLTIDGLLTGIAAFGAFLGYSINLIVNHFSKKKNERMRADRLTIMEILEDDLKYGLTEEQVIEAFNSNRTKEFRENAGASNPKKITQVDFSKYLRDLQWSSMIEQVGQDKYRLRVYPVEVQSV